MSLHDVTKNLQPAPVPTANPWCNAAKMLSNSKRLNSSCITDGSKTEPNTKGEENDLKGPFEGVKEKAETVIREDTGLGNKVVSGTLTEGTTKIGGNMIYNADGTPSRFSGKEEYESTFLHGGNEPENIESKLKEATNKFQSLHIKADQEIGGSSGNDSGNELGGYNNYYKSNSSEVNNGYRTFKRKARHSFPNNNRTYVPHTPPSMGFGQPLYPGAYPNIGGGNANPPTSPANSTGNATFLNNRRMSMPTYDTPVLPSPMFYPYMRNGFYSPMVDHMGMQQPPLPSRVYYGQQLNETNVHEMRVPMHMVVPNGIPIPVSPQLPVYSHQIGPIKGNAPLPNVQLPVRQTGVDERFNQLVHQIRYYFSVENLCKDMYLRRQMDEEGFIPISLVKSFSRVRSLSGGDSAVVDAAIAHIESIEKREVSGSEDYRIRLREGWEKWVLRKGLQNQ